MRARWILAGVAFVAIAGVGLYSANAQRTAMRAGADLEQRIALGKTVYDASCASCHGAKLEGQPDWRNRRPDGRLPAPPHDASGHTWHHADAQLLAIIRLGTAAVVGDGYESDMPGFADVLTDAESAAVLDYIKSTWPPREADYQRQLSGG
ncbi:c-type cytochrome [Kaistia adipata]|uniref:c-type cytochrome n=1 Tax=Kaistia adipata TaxID=166954 RepID=UPI0004914732|nr:cytochrome c [Kaistia adipata]